MNGAPRILNRVLLAAFGLVLLAAGAAAVALAVLPGVAPAWTDATVASREWLIAQWRATPLADTGHSWLWLVFIVVGLAFALLAVALIAAQRRRRDATLLRLGAGDTDGASRGAEVVIRVDVAADAIEAELARASELSHARVSAQPAGRDTVLRVTVAPRSGTAPDRAIELAERALRAWDAVLGTEVPALVEISAPRGGRVSRVD